MGYSLSWAAVRGKAPTAVRAELGLRDSGAREEVPESPAVGAELPGGWYLVIKDHADELVRDSVLRTLSLGCEVVACFVEEHVMCSSACGWSNGREEWAVAHDAQQGLGHLEARGALPPAFGPIRLRLEAQQQDAGGPGAGADYLFDIPVETAKALTGFRHDEDVPEAGDAPFEILVPTGGETALSARASLIPAWLRKWIRRQPD